MADALRTGVTLVSLQDMLSHHVLPSFQDATGRVGPSLDLLPLLWRNLPGVA